MADSTALLKRRGGQTPPGVRIPPSPLLREAAVVTRWRLLFCGLVILRRFLSVLKTVLLRFLAQGVAATVRSRVGC